MNLQQAIEKYATFCIYKEGCPFCENAVRLMPELVKLDHIEYKDISDEITAKFGYQTYPKIFVKGDFVGGFTDLKDKMDKNEL